MIKYLCKILEDFLENITKSSVTPAADYLFKIRDDEEVKKLPEDLAIAFHHTVAQLLFLSQRARRDAQLPVSFLTKRVKSPDRDDWNKLVRNPTVPKIHASHEIDTESGQFEYFELVY